MFVPDKFVGKKQSLGSLFEATCGSARLQWNLDRTPRFLFILFVGFSDTFQNVSPK